MSLDALQEDGADEWLVDDAAEPATERAASDHLAARAADRLVSDWAGRRGAGMRGYDGRIAVRLAAERALVRGHLTAIGTTERMHESDRHVVRRALADIVRHAATRKQH